jgi:hypothetical protein
MNVVTPGLTDFYLASPPRPKHRPPGRKPSKTRSGRGACCATCRSSDGVLDGENAVRAV